MTWTVEVLNATVLAELEAQPKDIRARYLRIVGLIESHGLERVREPYVKHLEGPLWEMRLKGRDGIARAVYVTATRRRVVVVRVFGKKTERTPTRDRAGTQTSQGGHMSSGRIAMRDIAKEWLKDPEFRAEYEALEPEFALASALIEARTRAGMTQAQVAKAMGTTQAVIARLEGGRVKPSTRTLERFAKATGTRLRIRFEPDERRT
jgi:phage-related protein/DNA-binding XRE family transcriptional regulator